MDGDHLYTISRAERDNAFAFLDYVEEGIAGYVPSAPAAGVTPFFRYFNSSKHQHFYTTSAAEGAHAVAKLGYQSEGVACQVFAVQQAGTVPLFRLVNTKSGNHFYTTSLAESNSAVALYGFQQEGVACFVFANSDIGLTPFYRLLESPNPDHTTQSQWATLLCKFSNDKSEPPIVAGVTPWRDVCNRFITQNDGSFNLVRFFADMSHGKLDLTGSQVFGWYDIDVILQPPNANGDRVPNKSQSDVINLAIQAAEKATVKVGKFVGVIVIMNLATGWTQGSPGSVAMDWRRLDGRNFDGTLTARSPGGGNGMEAFGQEVGHGYGLDHSRIQGSNVDYQDEWDTMSTLTAFSTADSDYCARGPGFNAWNMRARGWLDESRVWKSTTGGGSFSTTLTLRPLHHRDLQGWLAAELPGIGTDSPYLVELRVPTLWDAGIPQATVLVHRFSGAEETGQLYSTALLHQQLKIHSYLLKGTSGSPSLLAGDSLVIGAHPSVAIKVSSIDSVNNLAIIEVQYLQ